MGHFGYAYLIFCFETAAYYIAFMLLRFVLLGCFLIFGATHSFSYVAMVNPGLKSPFFRWSEQRL